LKLLILVSLSLTLSSAPSHAFKQPAPNDSMAENAAVFREKPNKINISEKPVSSNLVVFDSCREKWLETDIPLREEPSYSESEYGTPIPWGRSYKIGSNRIKLHEIDIYNLEEHLTVGGFEVPASFRGIWWMDGNPLPEVILSLHSANVDSLNRTIEFDYNEKFRYSFLPTRTSLVQWELTHLFASKAKIVFEDGVDLDAPQNGDTGKLDFITNVFSNGLPFGEMKITYAMDGVWRRETRLGQENCYNLRRIVDEYGKKLPAYDYFLKITQAEIQASRPDKKGVLLTPLTVE